MKTEFTKEFILKNKGCYSEKDVLRLKIINQDVITLEDLFKELPIKDFTWFLFEKCDLTNIGIRKLSTYIARLALPIYEKEYPNDNSIRNCIEVTERYNDGNSTLKELKSSFAASAASFTSAASAAASAASAASFAASAASFAASAASFAASAADASAADASAAAYRRAIWDYIKEYENTI